MTAKIKQSLEKLNYAKEKYLFLSNILPGNVSQNGRF